MQKQQTYMNSKEQLLHMTSHETLATPEMAYVMASFINIQAVYC